MLLLVLLVTNTCRTDGQLFTALSTVDFRSKIRPPLTPWLHVMTNSHWAVCMEEKEKIKQTLSRQCTTADTASEQIDLVAKFKYDSYV